MTENTRDLRGYVYLLKSSSGHYKIGRTANPNDRLHTFEVKLPFEVEYAHVIPCYNMYKLETDLQKLFSLKRINGEWYKLDRADVKWIKGLPSQFQFDLIISAAQTYDIFYAVDMYALDNIRRIRWSLVFRSLMFLALAVLCASSFVLIAAPEFRNYGLSTLIGLFVLLSTVASEGLKEWQRYRKLINEAPIVDVRY